MNTLYLHIGTHKTATTTIQRFCADNRQVLKSKGVVFPDFPFRYPNKGANRNGVFLGDTYKDSQGVRHKDIEERCYSIAMDMIHDYFKDYPTVLLSNERLWIDLYKDDAAVLRKLIEDSKQYNYEIRMIIYLRRQDQYIESLWSQQIKERQDLSIPIQKYIKDFQYLDYQSILFVLADLVGEENIIVQRFSEVVKGEGILSNFMHHLGLEITDEYLIEKPEMNPGIYGNIIEIKRIINSTEGLDRKDMKLFIDGLPLAAATSKKMYPCGELTEQERTELMRSFENGNNAIVQRFIGDERPLFSKDYTNLPKRECDNPEFIPDIIRSCAATDVILYRNVKESKSRIKRLENQISQLQKQLEQQKQISKQLERKYQLIRHPFRTLLLKMRALFSA